MPPEIREQGLNAPTAGPYPVHLPDHRQGSCEFPDGHAHVDESFCGDLAVARVEIRATARVART